VSAASSSKTETTHGRRRELRRPPTVSRMETVHRSKAVTLEARAARVVCGPAAGQLNKTQPVHPKQPLLLNALGFSLPAGQQRARDARPERPQRARPHARSTLCSNPVQARHAPATHQSSRIPALEKQRPRRLLSEVAVYQSRPRSSRAAAFGSGSRTRTCDHSVNSRTLYRLSYPGKRADF